MGHVHPPRALLYRLPNVSTLWGAIRARLGPERWLEAAAHVVHRACSAERAELVAAPRRVRVCVCMCVHLVPLCVVVLAAPGACMSLRVRYDIRVDLIPCTCVVFIGGVRSYILCGAPPLSTIVSLVSRALVARGALSHPDIRNSQPHTHPRDSRAHPHAARPAAPGRALRAGQWHGRTPTRRDIEHTKAQPKRHSHSYTTRTVRSAGRRARARAFSISGETRREAGGDRRLGHWGRAAALRINRFKRCDRESPVSPNVNIQVKSSLTGLLFP